MTEFERKTVRQLLRTCSLAQDALKNAPEKLIAPLFGGNRRAHLKWRPMPEMLAVPAAELCNPVAYLVLVKPGNTALRHQGEK